MLGLWIISKYFPTFYSQLEISKLINVKNAMSQP